MAWRLARMLKRFRLRFTGPLRVLPDFLILGAPKCGTTSLYAYLTDHPLVHPALEKEVRYFDQRYHESLHWYRAHFPTRLAMRRSAAPSQPRPLCGEATATYLMCSETPARARAVLPEARLIALLRNPVDRAFSNYQMEVRHGVETLSFDEALNREEERLSDESMEVYEDGARFKFTELHFAYQRKGIYAPQLRRWLQHYSREQLLIMDSAMLCENPAQAYAKTLAFLGLPPHDLRSYPTHYKGIYKETMRPATRERLREYYRPHNAELFELLNTTFDWER